MMYFKRHDGSLCCKVRTNMETATAFFGLTHISNNTVYTRLRRYFNMSMIATNIKDLFKIKIKPRHDSYSDQYNRILMVKILLACTIVLGINWYKDKFNCVVPDSQTNSKDFTKFVSHTCWVQGMYVYREMMNKFDSVSYYGVPKKLQDNGLRLGEYLCDADKKPTGPYAKNPAYACKEMTKTFFLQYQYMPFFICALALLYYLPYMISKTVNHDLINLREAIKKKETDIDGIVKYYFKDRKQRGKCSKILTAKQIANIGVKVAYIIVNFLAFFGTNSVLEGEFYGYGRKWVDWAKKNNTMAHDYMGYKNFPKPGNELLPPFGLCEIYASAQDLVKTLNNKHVVLCEISQHVLYQYVFVVLWFAMICGIVFSFLGLFYLLFNYGIGLIGIRRLESNSSAKKIFDALTYREVEYLEFMRKRNQLVYGDVLEKLKEKILGSPAHSIDSSFDNPKSEPPCYPMRRKPSNGPFAL
ncbi:innexin inx3-like isoform X1 [Hydractinia symbiolongicarpus]|uniref:innexin inx3-like isoform X1 n=2 Tax=Hydractinia symbiolongicarpus TaxID=13093 RepID=UPI00254EC9C9|nr:innexin inx3-like isoform X1 [Hydractinia symbiolongicarpus]